MWNVGRLRRIARTPWPDLTPEDDTYMSRYVESHSEEEVEKVLGVEAED
jgi:hypothetical protein